jgi:hypothetical protein
MDERLDDRVVGAISTELARAALNAVNAYPKCRNAHEGPLFWFCYHWRGEIVPGKEALDGHGRCEACAVAAAWDGTGEPPSFLDAEEEW